MQPEKNKQRFIPYRKADIIEMCCDDHHLSDQETTDFREVCSLLSSIYHFRFHKILETLKDCYAPVNPDADTKLVYTKSEQERRVLERVLIKELQALLNAANFEMITEENLQQAMIEESLFQIQLNVDYNDFEQVLFFRRGESIRQEIIIRWFGLHKKPISFLNYDRVVVYVKFKDQAYYDQQEKKNYSSPQALPSSSCFKTFLCQIWRCYFRILRSA